MPIQETFPGVLGLFVEAVITGSTEEEVNCLIEKYFGEYPKAGYSTEVKKPPTYLGGDLWEAKVKRYVTCD